MFHCVSEKDDFGNGEFKDPAALYHFAIPRTSFTIAHTTPVIRSDDNPRGWGPQAEYGNAMAELMARRILMLLSLGAAVVVENPIALVSLAFGGHCRTGRYARHRLSAVRPVHDWGNALPETTGLVEQCASYDADWSSVLPQASARGQIAGRQDSSKLSLST